MNKLSKKQKVNLIGKKCLVTRVYRKEKGSMSTEYVVDVITARPAWITGFSFVKEGYMECSYDEGCFFTEKRTIPVAKVRFWPTEKEFSIPLDAFFVDDTAVPWSTYSQYSEECKKFFHENIHEFPRDDKGRFVTV
jgi:uncharacterized membrane protein (UPF0127 family)